MNVPVDGEIRPSSCHQPSSISCAQPFIYLEQSYVDDVHHEYVRIRSVFTNMYINIIYSAPYVARCRSFTPSSFPIVTLSLLLHNVIASITHFISSSVHHSFRSLASLLSHVPVPLLPSATCLMVQRITGHRMRRSCTDSGVMVLPLS
jgi:hypothetical protein